MRLAEPLFLRNPLGNDLSKVRGAMPRWRRKGLKEIIVRLSCAYVNSCVEFEGRTLSEMQHNILEAKLLVLRQEPNFLLAVMDPAIQANLWQKEAVA